MADETRDIQEGQDTETPDVEATESVDVDAAGEEAPDVVSEPLAADDIFAFDEGADVETPEEAPVSVEAADTVEADDAEPEPDAAPLSPEELAEQEKRRRGLRWYVIHANTGHEDKVRRNIEMAVKANNLEDFFGEILVATQDVTEMRNGKRTTSKRKFFPSYVLVEMIMTKETQHFINSIPGVTRFIGGTQLRPQPITNEEVDRILDRTKKAEEGGTVLEIPYQVGDSVQVIDGPFSDWIGVINEINHDKGKLKVMISIFGSETPVELDFLQVKEV